MRIPPLMLIATFGLIATVTAAAADADTTVAPSEAATSSQTAIWTQRKLLNYPSSGDCDAFVGSLTFILVQLGAHDLQIDDRGCLGGSGYPSVDATFFVLVPANSSDTTVVSATVDARWQTTEIVANQGDYFTLKSVMAKILPLLSTRNVKLFCSAVCEKDPVGLRAQVLKPAQQSADAH